MMAGVLDALQLAHDAAVAQQLFDERAMLFRNRGGQIAAGHAALGADRQILRHQQIDAIRFAVHMRVDPGQFDFQLLRGAARRAEDAETARFADRRDHVAAVGEGEEWKIDRDRAGERRWHGRFLIDALTHDAGCRGRRQLFRAHA